jgi:CheY-like chemotaxis protein
METLLTGWGCSVIKAPDLDTAIAAIEAKRSIPNGLLVDYHLDNGNGLEAIETLRRRLHADLPAILITADRSPRVRADAHAANIQVLNKPIKPASLRAMLSQWRALRVAAAE